MGKVEAGGSLNLKPKQCREQVSLYSSLSIEGQKAEHVIEQGDHVLASISNRTLHLKSDYSRFRVKDSRKELYNKLMCQECP